MTYSSVVFSLGLGGVETRSYIGQPLIVEIPIYNVENPNSLRINLERLDDQSMNGLTAELSKANSQLAILIRSNEAVNEPYFNFSLNLDDNGNQLQKQFTVLLNLAPSGIAVASENGVPASKNETAIPNFDGQSVMGPYDWAKAGSIPQKFGAVLDGQSLWRVARRISPAMNVSNNQMMWALYQANPGAFSSNSVESLKAGSYLTIPSQKEVAKLSDAQAKRELQALAAAPTPKRPLQAIEPQAAEVNSEDAEIAIQSEADSSESASSDQAQLAPFAVTGVGTTVDTSGELTEATHDQSQDIIASLSKTISSMSDQLEQKERQIQSLKQQVADLSQQLVVNQSAVEDKQSLTNLPSRAVVESEASLPRFWWLGLAGLAAVMMAFLARHRLSRLWRKLNLSGTNDRIEFKTMAFDDSYKSALDSNTDFEYEPEDVELDMGDYTNTDPVMFSADSEDEFLDSELSLDVKMEEDLAFEERFQQMIDEHEYEFARQLLDIAVGQDVNQEQYHWYRLRILAAEFDEDGFYDYYYSIESDIPNFDSVVQTDISRLVVELAKH